MIPTIEDILNGLLDGTYLLDKAVRMVEQHIETVGLRDYFAARAMAIMWDAYDKGYCGLNDKDMPNNTVIAQGAYQLADAMLEARKP